MKKRAISIYNVLTAKFNTLQLDGKWLAAIGNPELTGSWLIYGHSKNGKTSFAMQLVKYLSKFERVAYNSIEEGLSLSIKQTIEREKMIEIGGRFVLVKMEFDELKTYLRRHKSPNIIVIDSVQFTELNFKQYKELKTLFPHKLFIYISHVGKSAKPEGNTALRIMRDANVLFYIKDFRAFPTSRYGGGDYINVVDELAEKLYGKI